MGMEGRLCKDSEKKTVILLRDSKKKQVWTWEVLYVKIVTKQTLILFDVASQD